MKKETFIRGMVCCVGDNFVIFYYLSAAETWPDKSVAFDGNLKVGFDYQYAMYMNLLCSFVKGILRIQGSLYVRNFDRC